MGTSRRMRAAAGVRERIKQYILEHRLQPGDPMPTELVLCEELGVSRSSVREAISQLDALDIVDVQHGRGTFVGKISLAPLVDSASFACLVDKREPHVALCEIVEVRRALERGQASLVVSALRGQHFGDLHALADEIVAKSDRRECFEEQDRAFHYGLQARASENCMARNLVGAFWDIHTFLVGELKLPAAPDMSDTARAHHDMLAAAEAGDEAAYITALDAHYEPLLQALRGGRDALVGAE